MNEAEPFFDKSKLVSQYAAKARDLLKCGHGKDGYYMSCALRNLESATRTAIAVHGEQ